MLTIHIVGYVYCNTHEIVIVAGVFHNTFTRLGHIQPEIVFPIPNFGALSQAAGPLDSEWNVPKTEVLFLSINRYERKKNLPLALRALGECHVSSSISV